MKDVIDSLLVSLIAGGLLVLGFTIGQAASDVDQSAVRVGEAGIPQESVERASLVDDLPAPVIRVEYAGERYRRSRGRIQADINRSALADSLKYLGGRELGELGGSSQSRMDFEARKVLGARVQERDPLDLYFDAAKDPFAPDKP